LSFCSFRTSQRGLDVKSSFLDVRHPRLDVLHQALDVQDMSCGKDRLAESAAPPIFTEALPLFAHWISVLYESTSFRAPVAGMFETGAGRRRFEEEVKNHV
jgi:hypothetical protein